MGKVRNLRLSVFELNKFSTIHDRAVIDVEGLSGDARLVQQVSYQFCDLIGFGHFAKGNGLHRDLVELIFRDVQPIRDFLEAVLRHLRIDPARANGVNKYVFRRHFHGPAAHEAEQSRFACAIGGIFGNAKPGKNRRDYRDVFELGRAFTKVG